MINGVIRRGVGVDEKVPRHESEYHRRAAELVARLSWLQVQ